MRIQAARDVIIMIIIRCIVLFFRPLEVFREVRRALKKPGGKLIISN